MPLSLGQEEVFDTLILGDIQGWPNQLGNDEPAVDVTLVPCRAYGQDISDEFLMRWSRIYFPRTYDKLLGFDVLLFNCPRLDFFTLNQQEMMVDFMGEEDKVPVAYVGSHYRDVQGPWSTSPISDSLPMDYDRFIKSVGKGLGRWPFLAKLELVPGMPPVFSPFKNTKAFTETIYFDLRPVYAKEGARTWIRAIKGPPAEPTIPAFISWNFENTEAWSFALHPRTDRRHWEEAGEWWELMFLNVFTYTKDRETIGYDEAIRKNTVKPKFAEYRASISTFHSILDFASSMGANIVKPEQTVIEAKELYAEAKGDYLQLNYEMARGRMDQALGIVTEAMEEATEAKDRALIWIFISEWLITTSVALVSGVVLWWLMVRRKLYREISTTQLRKI